eukprot:scaffold485_cov272-Pinguiococcus_pyrenoidosus.AAC.1
MGLPPTPEHQQLSVLELLKLRSLAAPYFRDSCKGVKREFEEKRGLPHSPKVSLKRCSQIP